MIPIEKSGQNFTPIDFIEIPMEINRNIAVSKFLLIPIVISMGFNGIFNYSLLSLFLTGVRFPEFVEIFRNPFQSLFEFKILIETTYKSKKNLTFIVQTNFHTNI